SGSGRAPERHCEEIDAADDPGTPSLERNPTWMTYGRSPAVTWLFFVTTLIVAGFTFQVIGAGPPGVHADTTIAAHTSSDAIENFRIVD
ncbi:MAG TPA: hypothetical protein PLV93_13365, partial [Microthrixaceae bacterium]|nr:hypothetical protein [Microthrixaceae bacterium]